jgi:glucokinase
MTNWPGKPTLSLDEASRLALPPRRTLFFNDMEMAARGLLEKLRAEGPPSGALSTLYAPPRGRGRRGLGESGGGNRVLVMPGTGLGTIGMVEDSPAEGGEGARQGWPGRTRLVPSEVQHFAASPLDADHLRLIEWLRDRRGSSGWPAWEDLASGYGLVQVYDGLAHLRGGPPLSARVRACDAAAWIARRAAKGADAVAVEALGIYYRSAGRVAQLLALAYQPRGGIFLAGASTRQNRRFIERSGFVAELHENASQRELLRQFPVYLVAEELNLAGALAACRESLAA